MTICVVCDVLGKENNGTTIAAMNLIRSLKKRGHAVRVVCPDIDRIGQEGFYVVRPMNLGPFNGYVQKNGVCISRADSVILNRAMEGVDHVHILLPFPLGRKALKIAKQKGLSVTASFHCQAENLTSHLFLKDSAFASKAVYRNFYKHFYCDVDAVHFPSEFIRETFEQAVGKTTNAYVISNGVGASFVPQKVSRPKQFEGKQILLFTGRYSKEKSHSVLLEAAAKSRHADTLQLILAGDGPLKETLKQAARKLPCPPIFRFFSHEELLRVINFSDLYVHPAEIEIEAIACLEAIACGLVPVISDSPRSATRYFALDEKNLFRCNDSQDLADKIDYWLDHPEEKAQRSQAYLGYTKQFEFEHCMDRMEEMILKTHQAVCGKL